MSCVGLLSKSGIEVAVAPDSQIKKSINRYLADAGALRNAVDHAIPSQEEEKETEEVMRVVISKSSGVACKLPQPVPGLYTLLPQYQHRIPDCGRSRRLWDRCRQSAHPPRALASPGLPEA